MSATHPLDQELGDLWYRRDSLSTAEWERLYAIVRKVLYKQQELKGLPDEHEDYVHDFYSDIVMRLSAMPQHYHVGGLNVMYRNYLRDCLRKENRRAGLFVSDTSDDDEGSRDHGRATEQERSSNPDRGFVDLREAGWQPERLAQSARDWLTRVEAWVPVFLAFHFCADADISEPLQRLAKRLGIKSYAYKAKKLGFNWDMRKASNSGEDFADTLIGCWLTRDLGIRLAFETMEAIHAAFKVLCFEALNKVEQ